MTVARSAEDVRTYVISVTPEFAVTAQPQDASVTEGADATFSVAVGGAEGLTYQWYLSTDDGVTWTKIDGANGASLTVAGTTVGMSGYRYECAIQGALGSVMTDAATLTVTERPYVPPVTPTLPGPDWDDVMDDVAGAEAGGRVVVDMDGETVLPGEVLEELAGRDVTLVLEMGEGVSWEVWGGDVPEGTSLSDVDMGVEMGTDGIPVDVMDLVAGEAGVVQVTLAHDGEFGFELTLVAPLGEKSDGLFANLYRYDEGAGTLRYECSGVVGGGVARLRLGHASRWAIALDSRSHALPFGDAAEGQWCSEAVRRAWLHGVMTGHGDGSAFGPDDPLTREQAAAVLCSAAGRPGAAADLSPSSDSGEVSEWAIGAVSWAVAEGVLHGHDGLLEPCRALTRAEAAALMANLAARG